MGFLAGKRILITGLLSNRSISYGIAKAMHREGCIGGDARKLGVAGGTAGVQERPWLPPEAAGTAGEGGLSHGLPPWPGHGR